MRKANEILAMRDNFGQVAKCCYGAVHVTIGPITVSLDQAALRTLHDMLSEAIEKEDTGVEELEHPGASLLHAPHLALRKVMKLKH
ncbi:MAG TPA: hypothetical protein VLX60_10230 [Terriglobales bacterium]|nr:hypothetical protein [Terriglobales bacterium]